MRHLPKNNYRKSITKDLSISKKWGDSYNYCQKIFQKKRGSNKVGLTRKFF